MSTPTRRLPSSERRMAILEAAVQLTTTCGYRELTQANIANEAKVSPGLITFHFNNMDSLRDALMRHAIETQNLRILAQGLAVQDSIAIAAPVDLRAAAANQFSGS